MAEEQLGQKEKIAILALEYNTLRAEIIARTTSIYTVVSVIGAVAIWALHEPMNDKVYWGGGAAAVGFAACGWFLARDIIKATMRVQDLESEINKRAGAKLLIWESELGGLPHGYLQFRYFFRLVSEHRRKRRQESTV
jgi:hypothetical protein